jgi:hypothetical protein
MVLLVKFGLVKSDVEDHHVPLPATSLIKINSPKTIVRAHVFINCVLGALPMVDLCK